MARSHFVKSARKDYPDHGIKKGESYYWWKFRFGGKRFSKTVPKAQDLTSSEFRRSVLDLDERLGHFSCSSPEDGKQQIDDLVSDINDLASEQHDKLNNMPEGLQQGSVGELLQSRSNSLEDLASNLESVDTEEVEREEGETDETYHERFEQKVEEINSEVSALSYDGE